MLSLLITLIFSENRVHLLNQDTFDNLVPRDESVFYINGVELPYYSQEIIDVDYIRLYVSKQYNDKVKQICINQFDSYIETEYPDEAFKKNDLHKQLQKNKPEEIDFFKNQIDIVESNERRKMQFHYHLPILNPYNMLRNQYTKEYEYYYKYRDIPETLHKCYQYEKTGKSFVITMKKDDYNLNKICNIQNSEELPIETINRTFTIMSNVLLNYPRAKLIYDDPIEAYFQARDEFLICNAHNNYKWNDIAEKVSLITENWISIPIDVHNNFVNIYGRRIPVFAYISGQEKEIIYLNQNQVDIAINKLSNMTSEFFLALRLVVLILAFIFSLFFEGKMLRNLIFLLMIGALIISWINSCFQSTFWIWVKRIAGVFFFFFSLKIDNNELNFMKSQENIRNQGRIILRNMIKEYIKDQNQSFLLKMVNTYQKGFDIPLLYEVNPIY